MGVGGNVSQGILKALKQSPLKCRVIGTDVTARQVGLFVVDKGYIAPWAADSDFIPWLINLCGTEKIDVILSGCEPVIAVLAENRGFIESNTGAVCLVNSLDVMRICDNKLNTCEWLRDEGFSYPDFAPSENLAAVKALAEKCGYPLIAKRSIGGGGQGMLLIEDKDDIAYIGRKKGYVVQEVLGDSNSEYTVGCFSDLNGNLLGSITLWRELLQGTTYRAVAGIYPDIQQEAERIVKALKPVGPCNVQLRMTARGPVCFEINPRFSGTTPIRAALGFNEVDAALRHFLLQEPGVCFPEIRDGIALRYWNEIYIEPVSVENLQKNGFLENNEAQKMALGFYGKCPK